MRLFEKDLPIVDHVVPCLALNANKIHERRMGITNGVVHTTGVGVLKFLHLKKTLEAYPTIDVDTLNSPELAALHVYQDRYACNPHFVVGETGKIYQVAPINMAAAHVGSNGKAPLTRNLGAYPSWFQLLARKDPAVLTNRLGAWTRGSVNEQSIGIELSPCLKDMTVQTEACAKLMHAINDLLDRELAWMPHCMYTPRTRTDKKGRPYDLKLDHWYSIGVSYMKLKEVPDEETRSDASGTG